MSVSGVIRYPGRHMGWVIAQSRGRDGIRGGRQECGSRGRSEINRYTLRRGVDMLITLAK